MAHEIENFYGVYLLYCTNPKYSGRTYIGFTVNPERRKKQHNKGKQFGGAWRTHGKGPWQMVLIIHGFPNMISALRFEWAWTKPWQSRRLKEVPSKKNNERKYDYQLCVLWHMLRIGPWNRLPLTIRWLQQAYKRDFPAHLQPPMHMPLLHGPVKSVKGPPEVCEEEEENVECRICKKIIQQKNKQQRLDCLSCLQPFHTTCLASLFLSQDTAHLLPVEGACPSCQSSLLWGDLLRFKRGCYRSPSSCLDNSEDWPSNWSKSPEETSMQRDQS